jgi:hypothetical protein
MNVGLWEPGGIIADDSLYVWQVYAAGHVIGANQNWQGPGQELNADGGRAG